MPPRPSTVLIDPAAFVKRVRWVMAAVILFDMSITFFGQPGSYWKDPTTVHEGNQLFHLTMAQGWVVAMLVDLVYLAGAFFSSPCCHGGVA